MDSKCLVPKRIRRANITITVLVISVLLLCSIALITFIMAKTRVVNVFTGVYLMEELNSQIEDYSVNADTNMVDSRINNAGKRVFYQEKIDTSGFWVWKEDKVSFSVEYLLP